MGHTPARPDTLGTGVTVDVEQGTLRYFESGPCDGPVVLLVHGLLANADLWRDVTPHLAKAGMRTLTVDWPLGAHRVPMPRADLSPPGVANLIASFMDTLDLRDVVVVANDTGGAITQILMARHPGRIGRVVLTPSDSFERFFPPMFWLLPRLARVPGGTTLLVTLLQLHFVQRLPMGFGRLAKRPISRATLDSFVRPALRDRRIRRDLRSFLRQVDNRHTLAAAERLSTFQQPVLLAWAPEDKLFPISLAERLAAVLPHAQIRSIEDSLTFVPQDQPVALAAMITQFVHGEDVRPYAVSR